MCSTDRALCWRSRETGERGSLHAGWKTRYGVDHEPVVVGIVGAD
jgi:hypothetical protein